MSSGASHLIGDRLLQLARESGLWGMSSIELPFLLPSGSAGEIIPHLKDELDRQTDRQTL